MIKINNLNYTYPRSKKHAVVDISFEIKKGEIFGFLGPSGAGKTTTQRLLIGLLRNYTGSIEIFDTERSKQKSQFFERIGVAFDFPNLYLKLTAKENLDLIGSYYKNKRYEAEELLDIVNLLPEANKKVDGFSKGMKMRLNFVRALMHDPEVLFFDEPSSGLDPVNAKIIKDAILRLKSEGKTIFLTTHNMHVATELCDRVGFMINGQLPVIGNPIDLMVAHGEDRIEIGYDMGDTLETKIIPFKGFNEDPYFREMMMADKVKRIHSMEATLEDIFIKLTGNRL
ncbi:MAG: ABC transporter ATP-binding protein [Vallitaleaceae bacterium]|jgi:fluoroquinolone transport system ATP-binding protein|nr:ABC transporter ATP-binding protein [Vallitaleaceae bacterium]